MYYDMCLNVATSTFYYTQPTLNIKKLGTSLYILQGSTIYGVESDESSRELMHVIDNMRKAFSNTHHVKII